MARPAEGGGRLKLGASRIIADALGATRDDTLAMMRELQRAVDAEQFELAAELRDKLRVME